MKSYYNGYRFSIKAKDYLYNPTLCLYFLEMFHDFCEFPQKMMDENLAVDSQKITYISKLPIGETMIAELSQRHATIDISELKERFGIDDLLLDQTKDHHFIASYLYYVGALTMSGETMTGELSLKIPNLVMKPLYIDRIRNMLLVDPFIRDNGIVSAKKIYQEGNIQPLCDFVVKHYRL